MTSEISAHYDTDCGWLAVTHDGSISWDELQAIKVREMGADVVAIEVYPPSTDMLNKANVRHLWRVPEGVSVPDLNEAAADGAEGVIWSFPNGQA